MGGGGAPAVTETTWFWSFGRPKTSIFRCVYSYVGGGASAVTERGGGGAPAVTERTWFWSFGRLKISILRAFCHSHVVGGGGGVVAIMH